LSMWRHFCMPHRILKKYGPKGHNLPIWVPNFGFSSYSWT
jgi:hypothetical protein